MATGDHPSTAKAIAKSVGILSLDQDPMERTALLRPAQSCLVTGDELKEMNSEELDHVLMHHQVPTSKTFFFRDLRMFVIS